MDGVLIGVDAGTTSVKAVVIDVAGAMISKSRVPITWAQTEAGVEIDPRAVLAATRAAVGQVMSQTPGQRVLAIGVASMGESGVLLDHSGSPLAPLIAWHDTRDSQELAELGTDLGELEFSVTTGLPFRSQWSLTKHRWQVRHLPAAKAAVKRLGVAEWIVHALGGDAVAEQSLASRTGWLNLSERTWWPDGMAWSEASPSLLPDVVPAGTPVGRVTRADGILGLDGAPLIVAGHDHQAAAVGAGATEVGDVLDSCGTAEALVRTVEPGLDTDAVRALAQAGITVGWHVLADRWCLLGGTQGGLVLQRVLAMLGLTQRDIEGLDAEPQPDSRVLVAGVESDSLSIHGVPDQARPADIWHAALRAVTAQSAAIHESMTDVAGQHRNFIVTGGWRHSTGLLAAKEAAFGVVHLATTPEAGAHGAARLAGSAIGVVDAHDSADLHPSHRVETA